jgi:hypothetical protein
VERVNKNLVLLVIGVSVFSGCFQPGTFQPVIVNQSTNNSQDSHSVHSCVGLGGYECTVGSECPGEWLESSDSPFCCSTKCVFPKKIENVSSKPVNKTNEPANVTQPDANQSVFYESPLNVSELNPGPHGCASLDSCVEKCSQNLTDDCRAWVDGINKSFNTSNQVDVNGKYNGVWLPTFDSVRAAAENIPTLKRIGVNTVSFGPDVETRHFDEPRTVGDEAFKFYVKLFEDSGFNVHLVPNSMHWGNNDVSLYDLDGIAVDWAEHAEALDVKFYALFNEVNGMNENVEETNAWLQHVLPKVREKYSGIVCVQPTQRGFYDSDSPDATTVSAEGVDCVSTLLPLMIANDDRNQNSFKTFTDRASEVKEEHGLEYVFFTDVHTFDGNNWAEAIILEPDSTVTEEQQAEILADYFGEAYGKVDGSFFNIAPGFTFLGKKAEDEVKQGFSGQKIEEKWTDVLWDKNLLELIESSLIQEDERKYVFDLETYSGEAAGWAGLCHEPSPENPAPNPTLHCTHSCLADGLENSGS